MKKTVFLIASLLIIIGSCSKKTTATKTKEKRIDAAMVFSNNCSHCHGSDGTNGRAPNLSKTSLTKPELVEIITKGNGHMPAFEDKLSEKEIYAVADFVVGLKK